MLRSMTVRNLSWPRLSRGRLFAHAGVTIAVAGIAAAVAVAFSSGRGISLLGAVMAALCAVSAWRQRGKTRNRHRRGWSFVAAGGMSSAFSLLWWFSVASTSDVTRSQLPGHTGMLAALVLFLAGGVLLRPPRRLGSDAFAVVLDLVIVIASLSLLAWTLVLEPTLADIGRDGPRVLVATSHVIAGGLLLLAALVLALRTSPDVPGGGVTSFPLAFLGIAVADLAWTALWIGGSNAAVTFGSAPGAAALTFLALVLGRERRAINSMSVSRSTRDDMHNDRAAWRLWLIYPLIAVLFGELARSILATRRTESTAVVVAGALAVMVLFLIRQACETRDSRSAASRLARQIDRDPLTGLVNYRRFNALLEWEIDRRRVSPGSLTVALIDVDRFKEVNDRFGHLAGDYVLKSIAATLVRSCRTTDIAARYAGDEFALVLADAGPEGARSTGERILEDVRKLALWAGPEAETPIGVSIGFAVSLGEPRDAAHLIAVADEALYRAKRGGRNHFVIVDADIAEIEFSSTIDPRRLLVAHPV